MHFLLNSWTKVSFAAKFLFLLLVPALVSTALTPAQDAKVNDSYKVIKVFGNIVVKKSGASLAQGDVISATESVIFKSTDAKASVVGKGGRFTLTPGGKEEASLRSNLLPAMTNISSRSGSILNLIDLQAYFNGNNVILDEIKTYISPQAFPMNETSFFYIQYEYKNEKVNKKLAYAGDSLIINRQDLFTIDGKQVASPAHIGAQLYYLSGNISSLITPVSLVFPDNQMLKTEVSTLVTALDGKTYHETFNEVTSYLNEFYGKPDQKNLKKWLARHAGLQE